MSPQPPAPPEPRALPGTAGARPASPRNASPASRHEPRTASGRCRERRARGRAAYGVGMAAMPSGCATRPEDPAPTILSTRRAGRAAPPAHSLYKRLASRSRERVGGAAARAALRAASAAIKVRGQRCAEKQARPNLQAGLVGSLRARDHLSSHMMFISLRLIPFHSKTFHKMNEILTFHVMKF